METNLTSEQSTFALPFALRVRSSPSLPSSKCKPEAIPKRRNFLQNFYHGLQAQALTTLHPISFIFSRTWLECFVSSSRGIEHRSDGEFSMAFARASHFFPRWVGAMQSLPSDLNYSDDLWPMRVGALFLCLFCIFLNGSPYGYLRSRYPADPLE